MGIDRFLFSDPTVAFLKRSLDVQHFRSKVIASNLANVDTPDYKARHVDFRAVLDDARSRLSGTLSLQQTNPRHLGDGDDAQFPVEVVEEDEESIRVDGNTVDQDKELGKLGEAQNYFTASALAVTRKLGIIRSALNGRI
jgi:flagellar basal-body rod protein FlgB